jgi:hypothetical protein
MTPTRRHIATIAASAILDASPGTDEHGLAEHRPSDRHAVQATDQLAVDPGLDAVGKTGRMKVLVGLLHLRAVIQVPLLPHRALVGTVTDHRVERRVNLISQLADRAKLLSRVLRSEGCRRKSPLPAACVGPGSTRVWVADR